MALKSPVCCVKKLQPPYTTKPTFSSSWLKAISITHNNSCSGWNSFSSECLLCLAMCAAQLYTASKNNLFKRFLVYICFLVCHPSRWNETLLKARLWLGDIMSGFCYFIKTLCMLELIMCLLKNTKNSLLKDNNNLMENSRNMVCHQSVFLHSCWAAVYCPSTVFFMLQSQKLHRFMVIC